MIIDRGITLDSELTFSERICCSIPFTHALLLLWSMLLSVLGLTMRAHFALVSSQWLPVVLLNLLQSLLCYATRLLAGTKRHDHISDHMATTLYGIGFLTQLALNSTFCQQLRELRLTLLSCYFY